MPLSSSPFSPAPAKTRAAAKIEDVLLDGEEVTDKIKVNGLATSSTCVWRAYRMKGRTVLGFINYDTNTVTPSVDLSALGLGKAAASTVYTRGPNVKVNALADSAGLALELGSENAVFLEFNG